MCILCACVRACVRACVCVCVRRGGGWEGDHSRSRGGVIKPLNININGTEINIYRWSTH